jgi:hypothetical protein
MIIVEGADNVGKTTLVKKLLELDPDLRQLKRKRFNPKIDQSIGSAYIRALLPEDGDFIAHGYSVADRMLASECIYGDLFRGGCRISAEEHHAIHNLLNSFEAIVIFCDAPDDSIMKTWHEREQMYPDVDPLVIARAYRERIHGIFHRPVIRYDWTAPDAEEVVHHIVMAHAFVQDSIKGDQSRYRAYFEALTNLLHRKVNNAIPG